MSDKQIVRATGPADLLALVPGFLGFHPEDSVVLVTVGEATHPFHARGDLPEDPVGVEEMAVHLSAVAARNGVTSLAVIVYTSDAGLAEAMARELGARLRRASVRVVCTVRADGERWWSLDGHSDPLGVGVPYDPSSHPLMAQAVLDGTVVLASRRELASSLAGDDAADSTAVATLAGEMAGELAVRPETPRLRLIAEGRWVQHRVRRFVSDQQRLDAPDVARLATLVSHSLEIRDVAWAAIRTPTAASHVDLWRDVVRRVPVDVRAAPASLLGFAAWLSGDGALAWCAVECAQESDPDYGLAGLLATALAGALPPSTWRPLPEAALTLFAQ